MINEELTFQKFGYRSTDWALKSNKKLVDVCDKCGAIREVRKADYRGSLCKSCVVKGRPKPEGWGEKHSQTLKGRPNFKLRGHPALSSKERSLKLSLATKGKPKHTEESKRKIGLANSKPKPPRTEQHQYNLTTAILKSVCASPNKFEISCFDYLNKKYPNKFKYVGDGSVLINGKSPDFISEELKTVVLAHGNYWHLTLKNLEINEENKRETEKIDSSPFLKAGYKVLFIWEDELATKLLAVFE